MHSPCESAVTLMFEILTVQSFAFQSLSLSSPLLSLSLSLSLSLFRHIDFVGKTKLRGCYMLGINIMQPGVTEYISLGEGNRWEFCGNQAHGCPFAGNFVVIKHMAALSLFSVFISLFLLYSHPAPHLCFFGLAKTK